MEHQQLDDYIFPSSVLNYDSAYVKMWWIINLLNICYLKITEKSYDYTIFCFIPLPDGGGGLCGGAGRAGGTPGRGGGGRFGSKPWVDSFGWVIGWKSAGEPENNIKGQFKQQMMISLC